MNNHLTEIIKIPAIVFFTLTVLTQTSQSWCADEDNDDDFQYWNSVSLSHKLNEKFKLKLTEELRFEDRDFSLFQNFTDVGLHYLYNERFELGLNYRHVFNTIEDDWNNEYRPYVDGSVNLKWHGITIKDRSRVEYRIGESKSDVWIYRNKITFALPLKWKRIQPYIAEEVYYDFNQYRINQNRVYLGCKLPLLKNLYGDMFFLWKAKKNDSWNNSYIIGTGMEIVL